MKRPALTLLALGSLAPALAGCSGGAHDTVELYRSNCARCHGIDGKGDPRSVALYPALDLTASRMVRAGAHGRSSVYHRISEGDGAMPGFSGRLETSEIQDLVDYVLRLPQGKASR